MKVNHEESAFAREKSILNLPLLYVKFLAGLFISRLGDSLYSFAIPWISYQLSGSVIVMGSIYAISVLPVVITGPFIGVLVDRSDKKKLLLVSDSMRALVVCLIPVLYELNLLSVWYLYVASILLAVFSLLFDVTTVSYLPSLVQPKQLINANSSYQLINQGALLLGPVIAGGSVAAIGGFHTLWFDAISYCATFVIVSTTFANKAKSLAKSSKNFKEFIQDLLTGFKWLKNDRLNFSLSIQAMTGNFGISAVLAVLMYYLVSTLELNAEQAGLNLTLLGLGGIIGSILINPLQKKFRRGLLIPVLLGVGALGMLLPLIIHLWLAPGIGLFIVSFCNISWNALVTTVRQETVPPDYLGRVLGFSRVFTRLAMPLGATIGTMIAHFNPPMIFLFAGAMKMIEMTIALCTPIRKLSL